MMVVDVAAALPSRRPAAVQVISSGFLALLAWAAAEDCVRPPEAAGSWCPWQYVTFNLDCDGDGFKDWACAEAGNFFATSLSTEGCMPRTRNGDKSACPPAFDVLSVGDGGCPGIPGGYSAYTNIDYPTDLLVLTTEPNVGEPFTSMQQFLTTAAAACTKNASCRGFNSIGYLKTTRPFASFGGYRTYTPGMCLYWRFTGGALISDWNFTSTTGAGAGTSQPAECRLPSQDIISSTSANFTWCPTGHTLFNLDCDGDGLKDWACTHSDSSYATSLSTQLCRPIVWGSSRIACPAALDVLSAGGGDCPAVSGYTALRDMDHPRNDNELDTLHDKNQTFTSMQQMVNTTAAQCTADPHCTAFNSAGYLTRTIVDSLGPVAYICLYMKSALNGTADAPVVLTGSLGTRFIFSGSNNHPMTYNECRDACWATSNSTPPLAKSAEKLEELKGVLTTAYATGLLSNASGTNMSENLVTWLGLVKQYSGGPLVWEDGTWALYTAWGDRQPDNQQGVQDCVAFNIEPGNWDDDQCTGVRRACLCELPAESMSTIVPPFSLARPAANPLQYGSVTVVGGMRVWAGTPSQFQSAMPYTACQYMCAGVGGTPLTLKTGSQRAAALAAIKTFNVHGLMQLPGGPPPGGGASNGFWIGMRFASWRGNGLAVQDSSPSGPLCSRPDQWCIHPGATYQEADCDGDGFLDRLCYDVTDQRWALMSKNCSSDGDGTVPISACPSIFAAPSPGGTASLVQMCDRPNLWCSGEGATYKEADCDGDGTLDRLCYNTAGLRWALFSKDCNSDGAGMLPISACPSVFTGANARYSTYVWEDRSTPDMFGPWVNGQPDNAGNTESCVEDWGFDTAASWNDLPCRDHRVCPCQLPPLQWASTAYTAASSVPSQLARLVVSGSMGDQCLVPGAASKDSSVPNATAPLTQQACHSPAVEQLFELSTAVGAAVGSAFQTLRHAASGLCMEVPNASVGEEGALVQLANCTDQPNQQFKVEGYKGHIVVRASGLCLDVGVGNVTSAPRVRQSPCVESSLNATQLFTMVLEGPVASLASQRVLLVTSTSDTLQCIDAPAAATLADTAGLASSMALPLELQQAPCTAGNNGSTGTQGFELVPVAHYTDLGTVYAGYLMLRHTSTGTCMEVPYPDTDVDGAPVVLGSCSGWSSQHFRVDGEGSTVVSRTSGKCLEASPAAGGGEAAGGRLLQRPCSAQNANQRLMLQLQGLVVPGLSHDIARRLQQQLQASSSDSWRPQMVSIFASAPGYQQCIELPGGAAAAEGTQLVEGPCNSTAAGQLFVLQPVIDAASATYTGFVVLRHSPSNLCLQDNKEDGLGSTAGASKLVARNCSGQAPQQFTVNGDGNIVSRLSSRCMQLPATDKAATGLLMSECGGPFAPSQQLALLLRGEEENLMSRPQTAITEGAPPPAGTPPPAEGQAPSGQAPLPTPPEPPTPAGAGAESRTQPEGTPPAAGMAPGMTPPTHNSSIPSSGAAEHHVPEAAVIGAAAGAAVLLAVVLAAVLLAVRRRRRMQKGQKRGQHAVEGAADSQPDSSITVFVHTAAPINKPASKDPAHGGNFLQLPPSLHTTADVSHSSAPAPPTQLANGIIASTDARVGQTRATRTVSASGARTPASSRRLLGNASVRRLFRSISSINVVVPHTPELEQQQQQDQGQPRGRHAAGIAWALTYASQSAPGWMAPGTPQRSGNDGAIRGDATDIGQPISHHDRRMTLPPLELGTPGGDAAGRATSLPRIGGSARAHGDQAQAGDTSGMNPAPPLLPSGTQQWNFHIQAEELSLGQQLGRGGFGDVYRAMWRGTPVAVKLVSLMIMSEQELDRCKEEVKLMFRLHHPNIVQLLGAAIMPSGHLAIVMELVLRGSLFTLLHGSSSSKDKEALDMRRRLRMAVDVAKGIQYLHGMHPPLVHRDIKSMNLLVTADWGIKVCDFGLSRPKHATYLSTQSPTGTPAWMAPEALLGRNCDEKSDVYSFGMVLYELFTGRIPWSDTGQNIFQLAHLVGSMARRPDLPAEGLHPQLLGLIQSCWAQEAAQRPSISVALAVLRGINVQDLARAVGVASRAMPVSESTLCDEAWSTLMTDSARVELWQPKRY